MTTGGWRTSNERTFEVSGNGGAALLERLRETDRQIAVLQGERLELIVGLYRRAPDWIVAVAELSGWVDAGEVAAAEIGVALRVSRRSATDRLGLALSLRDLPETSAALRSGELSLSKVRVIVDAVADLAPEHAAAAQDRVLPRAGGQTPAGLGVSVARAVLAVDPDAAARRRAEGVRDREVRFTPGTDGMASLWARLPAEVALGCYRELCELADLAVPTDADGGPVDGADGRTADARRADTLVDLIMGAGLTRISHGARCGRSDTGEGPGTGRLRTRVDVTISCATLAGLDEQPGWLAGCGPIGAEVARDLAADGTWRRLLTDPVTGTVTDVGVTRYAPPARLAELVRVRDGTCRWYGCRLPAVRCDLDHTVPFPDGPTAERNLADLCRGHHRLKTHTTWRVHHDPGGVLTWTSPAGQHVITHPWPQEPDPVTPTPATTRARDG